MTDQIFEHYRREEQPLVERAVEWAERVMKTHEVILTDFIDPRQRQIIQNIVNSYMDLTVFFDGGYNVAERVRGLITPNYRFFDQKEMGLAFLRVEGENKFEALKHKDYLGALLNIGIKREKFGDILLDESAKQYIVAKEIADYVIMQMNQIGHTKVTLKKIKREDLILPKEQLGTLSLTVSSMRVDSIINNVYNISRSQAAELIRKSNLKVNWQTIDQADYILKIGDIISLKGFGRFKFLFEEGKTKKGRIRIKIGKFL